jgi:hypothetical protein
LCVSRWRRCEAQPSQNSRKESLLEATCQCSYGATVLARTLMSHLKTYLSFFAARNSSRRLVRSCLIAALFVRGLLVDEVHLRFCWEFRDYIGRSDCSTEPKNTFQYKRNHPGPESYCSPQSLPEGTRDILLQEAPELQ